MSVHLSVCVCFIFFYCNINFLSHISLFLLTLYNLKINHMMHISYNVKYIPFLVFGCSWVVWNIFTEYISRMVVSKTVYYTTLVRTNGLGATDTYIDTILINLTNRRQIYRKNQFLRDMFTKRKKIN